MNKEQIYLLAEISSCRQVVAGYVSRLDDACTEYYDTGKKEFPRLSRAENEFINQQCVQMLAKLNQINPDLLDHWKSIEYPSNQYAEMVERMRDFWTRRLTLLRLFEGTMNARLDVEGQSIESNRVYSSESIRLVKILADRFSKDDLKQLCFTINVVKYEDLGTETISGLSRQLVLECERRDMLSQLIDAIKVQRLDISI